eukprot:SAG31_NODE_1311_length_8869_cov_10.603535_3_plen_127_part_00
MPFHTLAPLVSPVGTPLRILIHCAAIATGAMQQALAIGEGEKLLQSDSVGTDALLRLLGEDNETFKMVATTTTNTNTTRSARSIEITLESSRKKLEEARHAAAQADKTSLVDPVRGFWEFSSAQRT